MSDTSEKRMTISSHDLDQLEAHVKELRNSARPIVETPQTSNSECHLSKGELGAVLERALRIKRYVYTIHQLPTDAPLRSLRDDGKPSIDSQTEIAMVSAIRSILDQIEDRLAEFLPRHSSGTLTYAFHGHKKMARADGDAIRAEVQRIGREEVYRKWCFPGEHGFSEGRGAYSKHQVSAALAHDAGGHRRRRHHAQEGSLPPPPPSAEPK